tara:strand:- start:4968 stop:5162 length:195 start_codon:yes stop_codon:yes gene_type:complete
LRKKNVKERRKVALGNLLKAKFTPKQVKSGKFVKGKPVMVDRSEETWNKNREYQIEVLEKRVQG